jgi:sec-independent protein translocase protein TatB
MFGIGPMELVLILVVALLVLGPKRMPDLARTLGRGLGEFRRASNELRQSLALDDLKNDLHKGLTGQGTIHKPGQKPDPAEDRPAQAGDDLAPGTDHDESEVSKTSPASNRSDDDAAPAAETAPEHPGELPLDQDPHEHHDAKEATAPKVRATPADSELGNVPVGGPASPRPAQPGSTDDERG